MIPAPHTSSAMDIENPLQQNLTPPVKINSNNNNNKRLRLEDGSIPAEIDITGLNYDPNNQNRFAMFADLEIESTQQQRPPNRIIDEPKTVSDKQKSRKTFCPPIFLCNINVKRLVEQLENMETKIEYKLKNTGMNKCKLYLSDPEAHIAMMEKLRENPVQAYTFTPKELKKVSFVLRGLYHDIDVDNIKTLFDEIIPNVVSKVTKFTTPRSIKENIDTGLLLITLEPGKSLNDISHIKYIQKQPVFWEKPKRKNQDIQCRRCQAWGHLSKNCASVRKCVKCDKIHLPGECQRLKSDTSDPYCVNCKATGHTANWKGCPAYKKYVATRRQRIETAIKTTETAKQNVKLALSTSLVSPNKTFASFLRPTPCHSTKSSIIDEFLKLSSLFLQPEELSLEQEIEIFLAEYNKMSKSEAKTKFMSLLKKIKEKYGP